MTTSVDLWFDPICPWAWLSSRWLLAVEQVRDVQVRFHCMSLAVLNEDRELSPEMTEIMAEAWLPARACIAVEQQHGADGLRSFYTALGTRLHPGEEPRSPETVAAAPVDCGFDPGLMELAATNELDEPLRASHAAGITPVGQDVGTPVIRVNDKSLFGPIISPAPTGEAAGELFDGVVKVTAYEGFFELKRTRTVGPQFA